MARPSKLTDRQKCEIQRRHVAGETTRAIAKAFRVSQATVSTVVSGRTETIKTLARSMAASELEYEPLHRSPPSLRSHSRIRIRIHTDRTRLR
jgi:IS30 family transposase